MFAWHLHLLRERRSSGSQRMSPRGSARCQYSELLFIGRGTGVPGSQPSGREGAQRPVRGPRAQDRCHGAATSAEVASPSLRRDSATSEVQVQLLQSQRRTRAELWSIPLGWNQQSLVLLMRFVGRRRSCCSMATRAAAESSEPSAV